jgi:uncharacterized protein YndB with AHSA1/START domain
MKHHGKFCHESPRTGRARARGLRGKIPDIVQENAYMKPLSSQTPRIPPRAICCRQMSIQPPTAGPGTHEFVASVVIARPRHELYAFWRDFTNAPKFMARVDAATSVDSLSSMWTVKDAAGSTAHWEMLVTDDEPDRLIAWSTSGNSPVSYSGRVEFQDAAGAGTEVTAMVRHEQPSDPPVQSRADLGRLKEYMEARAAPGER